VANHAFQTHEQLKVEVKEARQQAASVAAKANEKVEEKEKEDVS